MKSRDQKITPCLWYNFNAEEAVNYYLSIFKDGEVMAVSRYGEGAPFPSGTVVTVSFKLFGQNYLALNGGPDYPFTPAVSLIVYCDTQQEIDEYWEKLSHNGVKQQCGWLQDKFGFSWQVVPRHLAAMMQDKDAGKSNRVLQALMKMDKIDLKELQNVYSG